MSYSNKKEEENSSLFNSIELSNNSDKSLNILIIHQNELRNFEDVKTQDFSNLETFYEAMKRAKEKIASNVTL